MNFLGQIVQVHVAVHDISGIIFLLDYAVFLVEFIVDIADNLFDDILDGYQSAESTIFVNQNRNMTLALLKFNEEGVDVLRLRNEIRIPQEFLHVHVVETVLTGLQEIVLDM